MVLRGVFFFSFVGIRLAKMIFKFYKVLLMSLMIPSPPISHPCPLREPYPTGFFRHTSLLPETSANDIRTGRDTPFGHLPCHTRHQLEAKCLEAEAPPKCSS